MASPLTVCPRQVQKEVDVIAETGVKIVTGQTVTDVKALKADYDAVLVAVGASEGKIIPVENHSPAQEATALDVLRDISMGTRPRRDRPRHQGAGLRRRQRGL